MALPLISLPGLDKLSAGELSLELLRERCRLFLSLPLCTIAGEPERKIWRHVVTERNTHRCNKTKILILTNSLVLRLVANWNAPNGPGYL